MFGQRRPPAGGARAGTVDPGRVLRRRRSPFQFALGGVLVVLILVVEEQGLIGPIGNWVLLQACLQARRWQDQFPDAPPLSVHVNLSGRQLEESRP